jgi:hypothetical protein
MDGRGITLVGEAGARLHGVTLDGVSRLNLAGLEISGPAPVRIRGDSREVKLSRLRLLPSADAGLDVTGTARGIRLEDSVIDGRGTSGRTGRGVRIFGEVDNPSRWVRDVTITRSDIGFAAADLVFIAGGSDIAITDNKIHDPQENGDHNDGVQSVGSRGLRIDGNEFFGPGRPGPDQAIILGHAPDSSALRVSDTTVVNNLIHDWRGTGIIVAGTDRTLVAHNTVARLGTSAFTSAGFVAGEPHQFRNRDLRVLNNIFDKIGSGSPIGVEDYNCVREGGSGPHDVRAGAVFSSADLHLAPTSRCRGVGLAGVVPLDRAGSPRGDHPDSGAWARPQ